MMDAEEQKQFQALRDEVGQLRAEVESLREFIKSLYAMIDNEQYGSEEYLGSPDFGRVNT